MRANIVASIQASGGKCRQLSLNRKRGEKEEGVDGKSYISRNFAAGFKISLVASKGNNYIRITSSLQLCDPCFRPLKRCLGTITLKVETCILK